ncbi:MAG: deoxyribonuclease IV [Acidobacteriota bacterium]
MPRLGAHLSAAGGPSRAVAAAVRVGCRALQLFQRPPGRWDGKAPAREEIDRFRTAARGAHLEGACFAHAPYLLNLASAGAELRGRSIRVLVEELVRGGALGLAGVVLHPGSAGRGNRAEAEARCRAAIGEAVAAAGDAAALLVLEGTAGMGGQLGRTPAELARLVPGGVHLGICLDTAHLWGAGYDLHGEGWTRVMGEVGESWSRAAPELLHGNDTPVECGSHRDRHAPPGEGRLGETFFRAMLADDRLTDTPVVLEIPPGDGELLVREALRRLQAWSGLARRRRPARR